MSEAAKVQQLPVSNPDSKDVLMDLRNAADYRGPILTPELYDQLYERVQLGVRKYGTRLQSHNGRSVTLDIRQELLDGIMYSHQGVMEGKRVAHIRNGLIVMLQELDAIERAS